MAYQRQEFINDKTVLTAEHLEHIEDGIVALDYATQTYTDNECRVAFMEELHKRMKDIGMYNTSYGDPFGGYDNFSTAYDMCRCAYYASGYEKMNEIWSATARDVRLLDGAGNVRIFTAPNKITRRADGLSLYSKYNVLGGKGGTHTNTKYNTMSICQSSKNPDDFYAIVTMNDTGEDTKSISILKTMDLIDSGEFDENELDEIAYDGLTYRQIFMNNNILPLIHENSEFNSKGVKYENKQENKHTIVYSEDNEGVCAAPYFLKVQGTGSAYLQAPESSTEITSYYAACYAKITNYTKGRLGVSIGSNTNATISSVTNGFQLTSTIASMTSGHGFFVGSSGTATLDGMINSPVIINMKIFTTTPSLEQLNTLYVEYVNRLQRTWSKMEQAGADIPSTRVCVIKLPKYNTRACKSIKVHPYYAKNAYSVTHPASMSKTLSMMLMLDYIPNLTDKVSLVQSDIDATTVGGKWYSNSEIVLGESLTFDDLSYMIMLQSSNICTYIGCRAVGERILRSKNL